MTSHTPVVPGFPLKCMDSTATMTRIAANRASASWQHDFIAPTHFGSMCVHAALAYVGHKGPTALAVPFGMLCLRALAKTRATGHAAVILQAFAARGALEAFAEGLALIHPGVQWITLGNISAAALAALAHVDPETVQKSLPAVLGLHPVDVCSHMMSIMSMSRVETIHVGCIETALKLVPHLDWSDPATAASFRAQGFLVELRTDLGAGSDARPVPTRVEPGPAHPVFGPRSHQSPGAVLRRGGRWWRRAQRRARSGGFVLHLHRPRVASPLPVTATWREAVSEGTRSAIGDSCP